MNNEQFKSIEHYYKVIEETLVSVLLSKTALSQYKLGKIADRELAAVCHELKPLSAQYVNNQHTGLKAISRKAAESYALYYLPINFAKFARLLPILPLEFRSCAVNILDYGCGPGTAGLAALAFFPSLSQLTFYDHSQHMLNLAREISSTITSQMEISPRLVFTGSEPVNQKYDLILLGNVLNELSGEKRHALLQRLINQLENHGILLIVEPALMTSTRALMQDRDWLMNQYLDLDILFPCTHRRNCPMLQQAEQWCHANLNWHKPQLIAQLDNLLGFNKHRIKYSALMLIKSRNLELQDLYRVLTPSKSIKPGHQALICGPKFYGLATLSKKNLLPTNQSFKQLLDFDVVQFECLQPDGSVKGSVSSLGRSLQTVNLVPVKNSPNI